MAVTADTVMSNTRVGETPSLSIVVPCYKVERYLARCLDSLLTQTLQNIEIICVNDGSPDGSLAIMRSYEERYPGKVRVVDQENRGLYQARWSGIDVARGTFVSFVDADDSVTPDYAERLYNAGVATNADIVVCGFSRIDTDTGKVLSCEMAHERTPFTVADDPGRIIEVNPSACNKAFRTSLVKAMPRMKTRMAILEDVVFSLTSYLMSTRCVTFVPVSLYNYMIHADSMINSVTPEQVEGVRQVLLEVRSHYEEHGASAQLLEAVDALVFLHLGVSMGFRLSCNPDVDLKHELALTTRYLNEHFPTWKRSPYISVGYAGIHGQSYWRLLISQVFYKAHLMRPFLATYRFVISTLKVDIKW